LQIIIGLSKSDMSDPVAGADRNRFHYATGKSDLRHLERVAIVLTLVGA
jgi:hypothetical protein